MTELGIGLLGSGYMGKTYASALPSTTAGRDW